MQPCLPSEQRLLAQEVAGPRTHTPSAYCPTCHTKIYLASTQRSSCLPAARKKQAGPIFKNLITHRSMRDSQPPGDRKARLHVVFCDRMTHRCSHALKNLHVSSSFLNGDDANLVRLQQTSVDLDRTAHSTAIGLWKQTLEKSHHSYQVVTTLLSANKAAHVEAALPRGKELLQLRWRTENSHLCHRAPMAIHMELTA